jgi:serine/threonine protein kinase
MGVVHLGTMVTPAGQRRVAIKQLSQRYVGQEEATERMVAEARLVFQLTHANICQVLDLATGDDGNFIVMEYVDGCDLKTLIGRAQLEPPLAVYVAREVAKALDYAHRRRDADGNALWLVHGDVTPPNILLSREGEVKLADFGIARALGTLAPGNTVSGGTPGFVAPEVATGASDQRADIYSLGVTLYAALTGGSPDQGIDRSRLGRDPSVSGELAGIVARATASRREDRYSTAADLERALSLHLGRFYPSFTASTLAEVVAAHSVAGDQLGELKDAPLVSLTGTATYRSPMPVFTHPPAGTLRMGRAAPAARRRGRRPLLWLGLAAAGGLGLLSATRAMRRTASNPVAASAPVPAATAPSLPAPSELPAPGKDVKDAVIATAPPIQTAPPAPGAHARTRAPRPAAPRVKDAVEVTGTGFLTVDSEPWGMVYVDGRRFSDVTPIYRQAIAAGTHQITVFSPDKHSYSTPKTVTLRPGESRVLGFKW